jgi:hypothetical protein
LLVVIGRESEELVVRRLAWSTVVAGTECVRGIAEERRFELVQELAVAFVAFVAYAAGTAGHADEA